MGHANIIVDSIAAYEVWSEPNMSTSSQQAVPGIGVRSMNLSLRSKQADGALPISEAHLHKLITEHVSDLLAVVDMEGRRLWHNPAYHKTLGYSAEELKSLGMHDLLHPEDLEHVRIALRSAKQQGREKTLAYRLQHKDGHWVHLESEPTVVKDAAGKPECIVLVARDITRRIEMEQELSKLRQVEAVSAFSEHLARDFEQRITGILANLSLIRSDLSEEHSANSALLTATEEAEKFHAHLSELMALSTHNVAAPNIVDLRVLITDRVQLMGSPERFRTELGSHECPVQGADEVLARAVDQLLANALESGATRVHISLATETIEHYHPLAGGALNEGDHIVLKIQDNGDGIAPVHMAEIFQPYFSTCGKQGMGLPVALAAVREHGGTILLSSKQGEGTLATVYLPRLSPEAAESLSGRIPTRKKRILFMDDERFVRDFMTALLRQLGYDVIATQDGAALNHEFSKAMESGQHFDLVITDLLVPNGPGGETVIDTVRTLDPEVKVILTSGLPDHPVLQNYQAHGFNGVLPKPFTVERLQEELDRALG